MVVMTYNSYILSECRFDHSISLFFLHRHHVWGMPIPQSPRPISRTQLTIVELILWVSFTAPLVLLHPPYEFVDGTRFQLYYSRAYRRSSSASSHPSPWLLHMIYNRSMQFTTAFGYLSSASMASSAISHVWALTLKSLKSCLLPQDLASL